MRMNSQFHVPANFIPSHKQWYYVHRGKAYLDAIMGQIFASSMEEILLSEVQP